MTVYEIELKGYDGSTDETDHLIKWVATSCGDEPCLYILEELWGTNQINSVKKIPEYSVDVAGIDLIMTASSIFIHHTDSNGKNKQ
jgi:hypothetical protein